MNSISVKCSTCDEKSCAVAVLNDEELAILESQISDCHFEKGELIFKEGTPNAHVFYLRKGLVKVHMKMTDSKDYIFKIARAPCFLGLDTIFGDRLHRYGATSLNNVSICIIQVKTFKELIHINGTFAYEIIKDICRDELNNFRRYVNQSHKQIPGRLAGALIYFSEVIYDKNNFELAVTRNEISELIGVSRESVTRCLTQFKADGIVKVNGKSICICKPEVLHKIHQAG